MAGPTPDVAADSKTWPRSRQSIQPPQPGHLMKCSASSVAVSNAPANVFPAREVHAFIAPISSPPRAIPIPQQQPGLHPPPQVIAAWSKLMPRPVTALPERGNEIVFVKRWPPSLQSNGPKCFGFTDLHPRFSGGSHRAALGAPE